MVPFHGDFDDGSTVRFYDITGVLLLTCTISGPTPIMLEDEVAKKAVAFTINNSSLLDIKPRYSDTVMAPTVPLLAVGRGHAALATKRGYKCLRCGVVQSPEFMATTVCLQHPDVD